MKKLLGLLLVAGVVACAPTVDVDDDDNSQTTALVEFDPANKVIPFPNYLIFDADAGLVNIPEGCNETAAATTLRTSLLNALDGFALVDAPIYADFTEPVDTATLEGRAMLLNLSNPDADSIALVPIPTTTERWDAACLATTTHDRLMLYPAQPLEDNTNYAVVLTSGIASTNGNVFKGSATWGLTRQAANPVSFAAVTDDANITEACQAVSDCTNGASSCINGICSVVNRNETPFSPGDPAGLASIEGVNLLWNVHQPLMAQVNAAGIDTNDITLAWWFKTQTAKAILDPAVAGSPAHAAVSTAGTLTVTNIISDRDRINSDVIEELNTFWPVWALDINKRFNDDGTPGDRRGSGEYAQSMEYACTGDDSGKPYTAEYDCSAIGKIVHGTFSSPNYRNPEIGDFWLDPLSPQLINYNTVDMMAFIPNGTAPADGWPVVFWGHGIGDSKEQSTYAAATLNAQGIAVVSFDWVEQGVRSTVASTDPGAGCADVEDIETYYGLTGDRPLPDNESCYMGLISGNPAVSRDNMRQSVVDGFSFLHALHTSCTAAAGGCGDLVINPDSFGFIGHSLGGYIGQAMIAMSPYPIAAVNFSVSGVNWRHTIENMPSPKWGCIFINALIDLGAIEGEYWDGDDDATAFCVTRNWRTEPAYTALATAFFWIGDAGEPAAFATTTRDKGIPILLQRSGNDYTVPNTATDQLGALLGLTGDTPNEAANADVSEQLTNSETKDESHYLQYAQVFDGSAAVKEYGHATPKTFEPYADCLRDIAPLCSAEEEESIAASLLGNQQMQADFTQFFVNHLK